MSTTSVSAGREASGGSSQTPSDETTALLRDSLNGERTRPRLDTNSGSTSHPPRRPSDAIETHAPPALGWLRICCIVTAFVLLIFMQTANITLMSTMQGLIADDLDAYGDVSWFTSAYLIGASCLSPIYGRLSQIFSTRSCVLCASILFAVGALLSSQATSLAVFLLGRSVQGAGAGGILTLSVVLVIQLTPLAHRGLFIGLVNAAVTTGVSLGAVVGGSLGWAIGWRALMWLQTPLSLITALVVFFSLGIVVRAEASANDDEKSTMQKLWAFDYTGSFLLTSCLVSLLIGLSKPQDGLVPLLIALGLLAVFLLNEIYRAEMPVIPVSVLGSRGILMGCFAQTIFMTSRWAVLFYSPIYMLAVKLWSPSSAGAVLIPTNAGFALGGLVVGAMHIRRNGSFYLPALVCFALFPISMAVLARVSTSDGAAWLYVLTIFLNGAIVGAALNYCMAHMLHLSSPEHHFVVTSLLATFRGFSGSFGSAVGGGFFTRVLKSSLEDGFGKTATVDRKDLIRHLLGQPGIVRTLEAADRAVAVHAYETAIRDLYIAAGVLAVIAIAVQAATGWKAPKESQPVLTDETEDEPTA